jgi:hypothetical protein
VVAELAAPEDLFSRLRVNPDYVTGWLPHLDPYVPMYTVPLYRVGDEPI